MMLRFLMGVSLALCAAGEESALVQLKYNHPGLVVDLGVGLWGQPFPVDFDGDGDHDLLVATADVPSNGIYFFENVSGDVKFPVFKAGVRLAEGIHNTIVSYFGDTWRILTPGKQYPDFKNTFFQKPESL